MGFSVLVAEEDVLLRAYLVEALSREEDLHVAGSVSSPQECLEAVRENKPQVLLLDLNLDRQAGVRLLERLDGVLDITMVLVLSASEDESTQVDVARSGARGFIAKSLAATILPQAIRAVARGEIWFTRRVSQQIFREHHQLVRRVKQSDHPLAKLTDREREVLACVARGMTNNQIAADLFMSVHTVKLHIQNILRKLGLPNRTEAAVYAVREGLMQPLTSVFQPTDSGDVG